MSEPSEGRPIDGLSPESSIPVYQKEEVSSDDTEKMGDDSLGEQQVVRCIWERVDPRKPHDLDILEFRPIAEKRKLEMIRQDFKNLIIESNNTRNKIDESEVMVLLDITYGAPHQEFIKTINAAEEGMVEADEELGWDGPSFATMRVEKILMKILKIHDKLYKAGETYEESEPRKKLPEIEESSVNIDEPHEVMEEPEEEKIEKSRLDTMAIQDKTKEFLRNGLPEGSILEIYKDVLPEALSSFESKQLSRIIRDSVEELKKGAE